MGRFQIFVFILLCLPFCFLALTVSSIVFTHGIPEYRCYVPGCDTDNRTLFSPPWLNNTLPEEDKLGSTHLSRCKVYNYTWESTSECFLEPPTNESIQCKKWIYDPSTFGSTIVTEFDLTCENEWFQPILGAVFMVGMLLGSLIFGPMSDKYGRRIAFISSVIWMSAFAIATAFSPNIAVFAALRFLTGLGTVGCFQASFVWGIEYVGSRYFILCGFIFQSAGTIASMIYTGIAYLIRDWRTLQLVSGVPSLLFIFYWWMIPESPRWLLSNGKRQAARKVMEKVAKWNKRNVSESTLDNFFDETTPVEVKTAEINESEKSHSPQEESGNFLMIFKSSVLRKRVLIMFMAWIAADMGYYGLSMTSAYLGGDFYVNFLLSLVVELPSYLLGIFLMDKLGRRWTLVGFLIIGGIACLVAGFSPPEINALVLTFSLIGKFSTTLVLANVYSYTAELFPTANRSAAVGMCSTCGRIGAILAPVVASTAPLVYEPLPFLIFGILNVLVGLLALFLPETLGVDLPTTIEEAIELEKYGFSCKTNGDKKSETADLENE